MAGVDVTQHLNKLCVLYYNSGRKLLVGVPVHIERSWCSGRWRVQLDNGDTVYATLIKPAGPTAADPEPRKVEPAVHGQECVIA